MAEMRVVEVEWAGEPASLATLRDVTERKRAGNALRFLVDASNLLAGSLDRAATLANVARLAVQHLADWCVLDVLERPPGEPGKATIHRQAADHGDPAKEALARTRCGSYPLAPGETGVACVLETAQLAVYPSVSAAEAQDLADRAALAVENARLYDEAQEAVKRRDEFLAMLAHELRNPLAPILNAAHLMKQEGLAGDRLERPRATIERQGQHLSRLLDDLLDLSRVTHGKIDLRMQPIDLATVVADAVQASRIEVEGRRHHLEVELERTALVVEGDPTRLAQVLENLLNNASRYTRPGGRIRLQAVRQEKEAVIRIADSGEGIPAEMLTRVFEPFLQVKQTLERAGGGLGIGLTLVRRLVELHGGRVQAFSDGPGSGSTFEVRLPLSSATPPPTPAPPPASNTARRILLIEDNADGREMMADLLRMWGHAVETVGDGATGMERIVRTLPDVALIDIGLPGLDGYEVARRVRKAEGGAQVILIAVTGYGLPEDQARTEAAGFDAHLVKTVDLSRLARLLERGRG